MNSRLHLERRAILLQKVASELLSNPKIKIATLANLIGDPTIFDKDISSILSVLYSHDNLKGEGLPALHQPIELLGTLIKDLESRGYKLPASRKRYQWIDTTTSGRFKNPSPNFSGGEFSALDKPLRRLRDKLYELRFHDDNDPHVGGRTGKDMVSLIDTLVSSVKKLATEGQSYVIGEDSVRENKERSEYLDKRYDDFAAAINASAGTSPEGPIITLYFLNSYAEVAGTKPRWYAVAPWNLRYLTSAVLAVRPNWDPAANTKKEWIGNILTSTPNYHISVMFHDKGTPEEWAKAINAIEDRSKGTIKASLVGRKATFTSPYKEKLDRVVELLENKFDAARGLLRGMRSVDELEAETEALDEISEPGETDDTRLVTLVKLPFGPDKIDDAFPSVNIKEESFLGKHLSRFTLELIKKTRFSGFVEFDDKYRMILLWANSPGDEQKDEQGLSFRDHLVQLLGDYKSNFSSILGQEPEVVRTKTGAALYFPKPSSLVRLVKQRSAIEKTIDEINKELESVEQHTRIERGFNRSLSDDEFPVSMEEG